MTKEYSIYHIENDIDCRVFKFGKEISVAVAALNLEDNSNDDDE